MHEDKFFFGHVINDYIHGFQTSYSCVPDSIVWPRDVATYVSTPSTFQVHFIEGERFFSVVRLKFFLLQQQQL